MGHSRKRRGRLRLRHAARKYALPIEGTRSRVPLFLTLHRVRVDLVVEIDGVGVVDWTGAIAGAVEWVTDGREGTCTLSLEFSGHAEGDGVGSAQLAGTVCGFSISQSVSIG